MSSGWPSLPSGIRSSWLLMWWVIDASACWVSIGPGEIAFTVTPFGPNSLARALVRPHRPCLAAETGARPA